ncbi:DUF1963 domain-containing protein [Flavobacterium rakeshii]|uniref:DUF1963 domain-containing protein n=1 Tax=Flavobacterium rakeshii TaxID=1038845 RepID=A0A6N8H8J2_9FLAO|nr:DUF1963 domain-containing protein [Flavobacterium rakeshii]MUV02150.1 DUF1963 domain-containing protein [Flavobacterium rakeshii]
MTKYTAPKVTGKIKAALKQLFFKTEKPVIDFDKYLEDNKYKLSKYERNAVKINATPINTSPLQDKLELKNSKFLGFPFFPESMLYPTGENGKPMVMAVQINFEEVPHTDNFPKDGILQLFFSTNGWYSEEPKIIYHKKEDLELQPIKDFSFLSNKDYKDIPINKPHYLSFEAFKDKGSDVDTQFDYSFDGMDFFDFMERLNGTDGEKMYNYFNSAGHKIGGYASFTQYDRREMSAETANDIQLLQIDTDKHIMFGDGGIAHIFINKENLMKKDFSKAYFYWDCF